MSNLPWEFLIVGGVVLIAIIANKGIPYLPQIGNLGRKPLYIAFGVLVAGGLIFAYHQEWIVIPPITRANVLLFIMLGLALLFAVVMLATSWGREMVGGAAFILGGISALILLFLWLFFPEELADMFSLQSDNEAVSEDVIVERLRFDHDYTYELKPGEVRGFDRTRDNWCILFTWEEPVPETWYRDWYEDGGDEYFLQNTYRVSVTVTVRMVYLNEVWEGMRCRRG